MMQIQLVFSAENASVQHYVALEDKDSKVLLGSLSCADAPAVTGGQACQGICLRVADLALSRSVSEVVRQLGL